MKIELYRKTPGSELGTLFLTFETTDACPDALTLAVIRCARTHMRDKLNTEIFASIVREKDHG